MAKVHALAFVCLPHTRHSMQPVCMHDTLMIQYSVTTMVTH